LQSIEWPAYIMPPIPPFGSALNLLNVHLHMLFLAGAYAFRGGQASFHRAHPPARDDLTQPLNTLSWRIVRPFLPALPHCHCPPAGRKVLARYRVPPVNVSMPVRFR
jgi:hypothetical protein